MTSSLYLNVFVLVVQLFLKVPALNTLAPTQSEAPFKVVQLIVLLLFVLLGVLAAKGFRNSGNICMLNELVYCYDRSGVRAGVEVFNCLVFAITALLGKLHDEASGFRHVFHRQRHRNEIWM